MISTDAIKTEIGKSIERVRISEGMTKTQLAYRMGVNSSYIGNVEAGRKNLTIEALNRFAEALGYRFTVTWSRIYP